MIIHFQILRSFSFPRRLSTCSGLCCQALNGNLGWLEESQLQRRLREKKNRGENKNGCLRKIRASTQGIKYCVSENGKAFQIVTTPRLYALHRERRDMALMQLLEHDSVFSESVNLPNSELEHSLTEEMPVLFHIETSMVQSLIKNVSNLKDPIAIKELIEGKAKELMIRVHVNSVLGSAVPSAINNDDIIIRTGHLKLSDNTTENVSLWHDHDLDKERLRCTDIGLRSRYVDDQVKGMAKTASLHASTGGRILMCSGTTSSGKNKEQQTIGRPDREQLELMFHRLSEEMPHFFEQSHDYGMYSQDLEFDNRIMRVKTKGLAAYKATVQSLKLASTAYLVNAHLELLRLTMQPENGTILARWRLKGVPLHSYILRPLAKKHRYRYFDAFSMFQVGSDGLIHHHRLDKIIPDSDKIKEVSMVTKIGIALGLVRPPAISTNWMTGDPPQV